MPSLHTAAILLTYGARSMPADLATLHGTDFMRVRRKATSGVLFVAAPRALIPYEPFRSMEGAMVVLNPKDPAKDEETPKVFEAAVKQAKHALNGLELSDHELDALCDAALIEGEAAGS